jgi:DNA helicase-2/ATP-dependent DNA helicase PcrA
MPDKDFLSQYQKLNPEQKLAVDAIEGPVLVIAGPGSGKTQLLSLRVANIIQQTDTLPSSILCLTFTESAAANMRDRLITMLGREAHKVAIHTFHSFGSEVINQNPEYFFFGAGYQPSDDLAQYEIFRNIFREISLTDTLSSYHQDHDFTYLKDAQATIKALKNGGLTPTDFTLVLDSNESFLNQANPIFQDFFANKIDQSSISNLPFLIQNIQNIILPKINNKIHNTYPTLQEIILKELQLVWLKIQDIPEKRKQTTPLTEWKKLRITLNNKKLPVLKDSQNLEKQKSLQQIYIKYQQNLHKQKLYDFEDMLLEVVKAFEDPQKPELKYNIQEKYQYILVDEFQDTNGVQMRLLNNLLDSEVNFGNPNVLAVGDDDQAVFKFQGASIQNILKFKENYPQAKIVTLTKNYRSTQQILDIAMQVIEQSSERLAKMEGVDKKLVSVI